eukprot:4940057-Pyramimonas_sp.AAC.1
MSVSISASGTQDRAPGSTSTDPCRRSAPPRGRHFWSRPLLREHSARLLGRHGGRSPPPSFRRAPRRDLATEQRDARF